jgi:hypothetical protein
VNQPVVLLVQIERSGKMEEGKIATWAQFGATEEIHQYKMRVLP